MTGVNTSGLRGRRARIAALALSLALLAAAFASCRDGGGEDAGRDPGAPGGSTTPTFAASTFKVPSVPSGPASVSPVAQRRFIRIGETTGAQFSPGALKYLADNFGVVLFAKFHGNWVIDAQHEAATKLKALRPELAVFPYFSMKYWFDTNRWGTEPDPAWLLRDTDGRLVKKQRGGEDQDEGTYVDLANPEYRNWALGVLRSWLVAAPYSGISFDAADPIGDYPDKQVREWASRIGAEKVKAYNSGLRDLLRRANELAGPDRAIVFNGFSQNPIRGPHRDLDLLEFSDGALDERFCLDRQGDPVDIRTDLELLERHSGSLMMVRTNVPREFSAPERAEAARFCTAAFLLGWEPGRSFFQFATSYNSSQLEADDVDQRVDLGAPTGDATWTGEVGVRKFAAGAVAVNLGDSVERVRAPVAGSIVERGETVRTVADGETVELAAGTAIIVKAEARR